MQEEGESSQHGDDIVSTAYYNLGVENEHLRDYAAAQECFAKSKLAAKILPEIEQKTEKIAQMKLHRLAIRHKNSVMMSRGSKVPTLTPVESPRATTKMVGRQFHRSSRQQPSTTKGAAIMMKNFNENSIE